MLQPSFSLLVEWLLLHFLTLCICLLVRGSRDCPFSQFSDALWPHWLHQDQLRLCFPYSCSSVPAPRRRPLEVNLLSGWALPSLAFRTLTCLHSSWLCCVFSSLFRAEPRRYLGRELGLRLSSCRGLLWHPLAVYLRPYARVSYGSFLAIMALQ